MRDGEFSALEIARCFKNPSYTALLTPTPFWRLQGHIMALYPLRLMTQVASGWQLVWPGSSPLWLTLPLELITLVLSHLATDLAWPPSSSVVNFFSS